MNAALEPMVVHLFDPGGLLVEEITGDLDAVTQEVRNFADSMLIDGLNFSVEIVSAPRSGCKECNGTVARTVARIDSRGQVVCAACGLPVKETA